VTIIRHDDGSLTIPVTTPRSSHSDTDTEHVEANVEAGDDESSAAPAESTMVVRPGEGGYVEALAAWDLQQDPTRGEAVSTVSGREQAMAVVHAVAVDPDHVAEAVEALADPDAGAQALRHVLVGGNPSIRAFASEVADAEGGEPLAPHTATKLIGEVLAEIDRAE
jgi:hypothetical protein